MDAAQATQRRMMREAVFALTAIVLAGVGFSAVFCWKFGVFAPARDVKPPPPVGSLAELPEYVAMQRAKEAQEHDDLPSDERPVSATVVRASGASSWRTDFETVEYDAPVETSFGGSWTPSQPRHVDESDDQASLAAPVETTLPPPPTDVEPFVPRTLIPTETARPINREAPPDVDETASPFGQRVNLQSRPALVTPFIEDELPATNADEIDLESQANSSADETVQLTSAIDEPQPTAVTVAPDDSFFRIAKRVYGDGEFYKALYEHNRHRFHRAGDLPVGAIVDTPPAEELQRLYPTLAPVPVDATGR